MRLATVPVTVNEAEPLAPEVKDRPDVDDRVSVPCATESVSESALVPALASATLIALPLAVEKVSEPFWSKVADDGALTVGA